MKILLTGFTGCLGTELIKINPYLICLTKKECDVVKYSDISKAISTHNPDIVIHAAAITDNRIVEKCPIEAVQTNIIGTANIAMECIQRGIRLVYISTDYIYKGDRGNYQETDDILPFNLYSWTKLGGECSVKAVTNHLIIRTSFGKSAFDYKEAFIDKWTSKDYVDKIAPMIYEAAISPLTGVLNLGTERKTLYEHASKKSNVIPVKIEDTSFVTPYDTSLNLQKWIEYKTSNAIARPHNYCRVCGSSDLIKYLDLGLMPLANNLEFTSQLAKTKEQYPLQVMLCPDCGLSQLSIVVDPKKMFDYYTYRSSINKGYLDHCKDMCESLTYKFGLNENTFHIDIAGNDGALLKVFKGLLRHKVLNVDPASNLTAIAEADGIPSITDFWGSHLVGRIDGKADLITATNVFAHLDKVGDFIRACKEALAPDGILVIENPYLIDFIENMAFDTVYFEHVSYWSVNPMMELCCDSGMKVINVEKQAIHGGSMRYTIAHTKSKHIPSSAVVEISREERNKGYGKIDSYLNWSNEIKIIIEDFGTNLLELKKQGNTIIGFAASAKGNTLLNCAKINTDIVSCIIDQTPEKIGKFSPGTGIPIYGIEKIMKINPDYIVILSWNFKEEIIEKIKLLEYKGKFIIPIPTWEVI